MAKYYEIPIKEVIRETPDAVTITLDVPKKLEETFHFKAGQHLAFKHNVNGEELRRNYSLCCIPGEGWKIAIKKIPGGRFSSFANEKLNEGDLLQVMPATGHFTIPFHTENQGLYVAFAAGSGITPVISLIKEGLRIGKNSEFILVYGNRRQESILFKDELADLKSEFMGRFSLFHVLSKERLGSKLQEGRIDQKKCRAFARTVFNVKDVDQFLLCGPQEMIFTVKECLETLGADPTRIKFELFTTEGLKPRERTNGTSPKAQNDSTHSAVEVIMDGNHFSFNLNTAEKSVLDAAVDAGADLPFSCKGGVCSTCKAKLIEGEVYMDVNYALEPDEIEAGYILTCQSHPKSDKLVIDFDQ